MEKLRIKLVREKVVITIYQYLISKIDDDEIKNSILDDKTIKNDSKEYEKCIEMIDGIIKNMNEYDVVIEKSLKEGWKIDRLTKLEHSILLVAYFESVNKMNEKQIIINEAIELAKKYCDNDAYKYINGVLNTIVNG